MVKNKREFSLLTYILIRIVPPLLVLTGLMTWHGINYLHKTSIEKENDRLRQLAISIRNILEVKLSALSFQAKFLAENNLISGSLADFRQRNETLPVFFQSLTVSSLNKNNPGRIALLDYKGRIIASNQPVHFLPNLHEWLASDSQPNEKLIVENEHMSFLHAVYLNGMKEGAILIQISISELNELLHLNQWVEHIKLRLKPGLIITNSHVEPVDGLTQTVSAFDSQFISSITLTSSVAELLAAKNSVTRIFVTVGLFSLLLLCLFLGSAIWLSTRPLREVIKCMQKIGAHADLSHKLEISGFSEISQLVETFNRTLERLLATTSSKEQYELVLRGTNDGIWDWDIRSDYLFLSKRWKEQLGYDENELTNHFDSFKKLIFEEDLEMVFETVDKFFKNEIPTYSIEFRMRHKDGSLRWIWAKGEALREKDGTPFRMAGSHTDITQQKMAQKELLEAKESADKASRAKSEFLANMSHEIRTPLNAVIGFTNLLQETQLTDDQQQYVKNAGYSSQMLLSIINDILDFSKIEAGMMELEIIQTDMVVLIEQVSDSISPAVNQKNLEMITMLDNSMPRFAFVDPVRVTQILNNLLNNAVKFTSSGKIELHVSFENITDTRGQYHFSVKDTGIGISEENLPNLFKAFSQADNSTTRKFGGTGLGLIISEMIARKMGSSIEVQSKAGEGTTFFFTLEANIDAVAENTAAKTIGNTQASKSQTEIQTVKKLKILIVEDIELNMTLVKALLRGICPDASVFEASNGIEAIERWQKESPDIILMDKQMPEMDGVDATRKIRQLAKDFSRPYIIALTAGALSEEREKCLAAGMNDFITKPVTKETLKNAIFKNLPALTTTIAVTTESHFDFNGFMANIGNDKELAKTILNTAQSNFISIIEDLEKNVIGENLELTRKAGHKLKGASANMRFIRLAGLAQKIEHAAKSEGNRQNLQKQVLQIRLEWNQITETLQQHGFTKG